MKSNHERVNRDVKAGARQRTTLKDPRQDEEQKMALGVKRSATAVKTTYQASKAQGEAICFKHQEDPRLVDRGKCRVQVERGNEGSWKGLSQNVRPGVHIHHVGFELTKNEKTTLDFTSLSRDVLTSGPVISRADELVPTRLEANGSDI